MEILQLRYFCSAAETENFSATANRYRVPPSDISQSIKRLENELDIPLFERSANRVRLSDRGREFYVKINRVLQLLDTAVQDITTTGAGGQLRILIGSNRRITMQAVERFRNEYPSVDIVAQHSSTALSEDFDLIVTAEHIDAKEFERTRILSEELCLAVRRDNPIASLPHLSAEDLEPQAFISMSAGAPLYTITKEICADMGFTPHIAIQSDDPFYIRKCVEMGLGVAVVPEMSWRGQFSSDTVLRRLNGQKRDTYVYRRKNKILLSSTESFIRILTEECSKEMTR